MCGVGIGQVAWSQVIRGVASGSRDDLGKKRLRRPMPDGGLCLLMWGVGWIGLGWVVMGKG